MSLNEQTSDKSTGMRCPFKFNLRDFKEANREKKKR